MGIIGNLDDPRLPYDYANREKGTVPPDESRARFQWASEVAYKNVHRIVTRGYDTTELVEQGYGVCDIIFIDFQSRIPLEEELKMLNYCMIMALEDGLSSPANMARIVASSKIILTQAAGASILAFGHAFGAYDAFGKMLNKGLALVEEGKPMAEAAGIIAKENMGQPHLGVSELMLEDPAAKRMIARAEKLGLAEKYIPFMKEIIKAVQALSDEPVDIDMLGAMGAAMFDIGFSPEATWAVLAVTRAFAAGCHFMEEVECEPPVRLGEPLTPKELYVGQEDRPVPSLKERDKAVHSGQFATPAEWKKGFDTKQKMRGTGWAIVEEIADPRKMQ